MLLKASFPHCAAAAAAADAGAGAAATAFAAVSADFCTCCRYSAVLQTSGWLDATPILDLILCCLRSGHRSSSQGRTDFIRTHLISLRAARKTAAGLDRTRTSEVPTTSREYLVMMAELTMRLKCRELNRRCLGQGPGGWVRADDIPRGHEVVSIPASLLDCIVMHS